VDPLENAVWHSLVGDLAHLAQASPADEPRAVRFDPAVSVFAAVGDEPTPASWSSMAELVGPGGTAVLFRADPVEPEGWTTLGQLDGFQMLGPEVAGEPIDAGDGLVRLTAADVPEMLELVARSEPGPFDVRTIETGRYFGARRDGHLVAMAGQRLRCAGWVEISAVCTDPAHRGLGLARRMVGAVVADIREEGATPYLQVKVDNEPALALYRSMGFETVRTVSAVALRCPGA